MPDEGCALESIDLPGQVFEEFLRSEVFGQPSDLYHDEFQRGKWINAMAMPSFYRDDGGASATPSRRRLLMRNREKLNSCGVLNAARVVILDREKWRYGRVFSSVEGSARVGSFGWRFCV